MSDFRNTLAWSYSRSKLLTQCLRHYYYNHYLMWEGWLPDADPQRAAAYRLKQMKTLSMLGGEIVHRVIREILTAFRRHKLEWTPEMARNRAQSIWKQALRDSSSGRWRENPKRVVCVFEEYYGYEDYRDRVSAAWSNVVTCLDNFFLSQTWETLRLTRPERWLALDSEHIRDGLIDVDGIPCYMVIDLGYDLTPSLFDQVGTLGRCPIFDWKTGRPKAQDQQQLAYYAIFAETKWGFACEQVTARLVYLQEYDERDVPITAEMLAEARANLQASFAHMQALLTDVTGNHPLPLSSFPATENPILLPLL